MPILALAQLLGPALLAGLAACYPAPPAEVADAAETGVGAGAAAPAPGQPAPATAPGPAPQQEPRDPAPQPGPERREGFDHTHALLTAVLGEHVRGDRFDYAALAEDHATLDRYITGLERVTPEELASWTREQRFAFWINVYNAHVLSLVAGAYPVRSIKDVGSLVNRVWKRRFIDLPAFDPTGKGRRLSLDDVEHGILRPQFEDPRLHAAVNCASVGCPPLWSEALAAATPSGGAPETGATPSGAAPETAPQSLDAQLDAQVRSWLADPRRNRFDAKQRTLHLSRIFEWFEEDFVRDSGSVPAWVARFAPPAEAGWLGDGGEVRVRYLEYSWELNDLPRTGRR